MKTIKDDCPVGQKIAEIEALMSNLGISICTGVNGELRINVNGKFGNYILAIVNSETGENKKCFPRCTEEEKLLWVNFDEVTQ